MRRQYARIRRTEAQAAQQRRKAEALLESIRFAEATASESEKGALAACVYPHMLKCILATKPLATFLEVLRKLYDIPIPPPNSAASARPTASKEAYLTWAVDKLMKENAIDKMVSRDAEEQAKLVFDSDEIGDSSMERLPPGDDSEDDGASMSNSSTGTDEEEK